MVDDFTRELEQISQDLDYKATIDEVKTAINSCASELNAASGISLPEAKKGGYYTASTHRQSEKKVNPSLVSQGPTGTGKSQLMKVLRRYVYKPSKVINAKEQTFAVVRDRILDEQFTNNAVTFCIEESDRCVHSHKLEEWISNTYERDTSAVTVKRCNEKGMFIDIRYSIFNPVIQHRRMPLYDAANARRAIVIQTRQIPNAEFPQADDIQSPNADKMALVTKLVLPPVSRLGGIEGGIWNNYEMMLSIAMALGDYEWMSYMQEQMQLESTLLQEDRSFEPDVAILGALVRKLESGSMGIYKPVSVSDIAMTAKHETGHDITSRMAAKILRQMKIEVHTSHGQSKVFPTSEALQKATAERGLPQSFLFG